MIVQKLRLPINQMSYSFRHEGLNSLETKEVNEIEETISALLISIGILRAVKPRARQKYRKLIKNLSKFCGVLAYTYVSKTTFYVSNVLGPTRLKRTINSFTAKECWRRFRFRKRDLKRLLVVFGLDEVGVTLGTESKRGQFSGEEIFLYSLYRLASTTSHGECESLFNTDASNLSAMYNWFIGYMHHTFGHLVTDNVPYWSESFPAFSEAIRIKFTARTGLEIMVGNFKIVAFHDCTVIACCRPGGGPSVPGQNAPRYNNFIQMAFYNGWKHMHGTKWLTVELPNGMCMDMHGPFSFRHNDLELFEDARLNERMEAAQVNQENRFCSYGDSIFPNLTCCKSKHRADALTQEEQLQNAGMGSMRIANEWHYGFTANLFPRVKHKSSLKIMQSQNVSVMYLVCTLLRNARTCLYGSQTSRYFNCMPPTLENYFSQGEQL